MFNQKKMKTDYEESFAPKQNIAEILYGKKTKEEKNEKDLRNSLINELGDSLETKHILYSSVDELKDMKKEKEKKNAKNSTEPTFDLFKSTNSPQKSVLSSENNLLNKEGENQKFIPKLLSKIQSEKSEKIVSGRILSDDWDKQEILTNNIKTNNRNNGIFSLENTRKARDFIQGSEGFRDVAYQDSAGVWTIGYGHTGQVNGKPITKDTKISKEEAEELYRKDFEKHIEPLKNIKTPLTKNQQIALASLIYNIGPGILSKEKNLRKKLDAGDIKGAVDEFDKYIYARNKNTGKKEVLKGLVNRRKREKELFLTPDEEP